MNVGLVCTFVFCIVVLSYFMGFAIGENTTKREGYERGYLTECLGKAGYYWECE